MLKDLTKNCVTKYPRSLQQVSLYFVVCIRRNCMKTRVALANVVQFYQVQ
jgi:hypothetical protein